MKGSYQGLEGGRIRNILVKEYRVLVGNDEKVLEMDGGDITTINMNVHQTVVKMVYFVMYILQQKLHESKRKNKTIFS